MQAGAGADPSCWSPTRRVLLRPIRLWTACVVPFGTVATGSWSPPVARGGFRVAPRPWSAAHVVRLCAVARGPVGGRLWLGPLVTEVDVAVVGAWLRAGMPDDGTLARPAARAIVAVCGVRCAVSVKKVRCSLMTSDRSRLDQRSGSC